MHTYIQIKIQIRALVHSVSIFRHPSLVAAQGRAQDFAPGEHTEVYTEMGY